MGIISIKKKGIKNTGGRNYLPGLDSDIISFCPCIISVTFNFLDIRLKS